MEFFIKTASGLGYVWEGDDIGSAIKPYKDAYVVPVAGGHHRFKININTIDELCNLIKEIKYSIVVSNDTITIYDDYIE